MADYESTGEDARVFVKMQGLGNDFVVFDATRQALSLSPEQVRHIADRRYGVGCDQVLVLEPARDEGSDFFYRVFNADGGEVSQCGNGARCVARLAMDTGLIPRGPVRLGTREGRMIAEPADANQVRVDMGVPAFSPQALPADISTDDNPVSLTLDGETLSLHLVSLGNPHAVIRVEDVASAPVTRIGPRLESHPAFPERVNVGFLQVTGPDAACLRVWERGAGETLACGSGACAAMAVGRRAGWFDSEVKIRLQGGNLVISFESEGRPLWMQGPAEYAFTGHIRL